MVHTKLIYILLGIIFFFFVCATVPPLLADGPERSSRSIEAACSGKEYFAVTRDCYAAHVTALIPRGLPFTFSVVKLLYKNDPKFAQGCHYLMHPIGEAAYDRYKDTNTSDFMVSDASACNYGFYHGFIGALMEDTHNIHEAKRFCDLLGPAILSERPDAANQCYHGLGHGFLEGMIENSATDIKNIDSVKQTLRSVVDPATKNCEAIASTTPERAHCLSGFFHGIAMLQETGGWEMDRQNPMWLCEEVPSRYQHYCTGNQHRLVIDRMPNATLDEVIAFAEPLYKQEALTNVIWRWGYNHATDFKKSVEIQKQCASTLEAYRPHCISGIISRLQENGAPGEEYLDTTRLCLSRDISDADRALCAEHSFKYFQGIYPDQKMQYLCDTYKSLYAPYCTSAQRDRVKAPAATGK